MQGGSGTLRQPPSNSISGYEGEDNRDALFCAYCKKRRHTKENSWKLAWKNQNAGKKAFVSMLQPQDPRAGVTSPRVEEVQENLSSTALVNSGNSFTNEWIADTGATDHMSPDSSLFSMYMFAGVIHRVQTAKGGMLPVKGVGDILLTSLGVLKKVLYVEDLHAKFIFYTKDS